MVMNVLLFFIANNTGENKFLSFALMFASSFNNYLIIEVNP
jgi:hypothetical protein